ncbi:hypothetical protein GW17_00036508, partial [Ensete ventricosum]
MFNPKRRITRQRSHPRPVLSGQLMVIKLGSPGLSGGRMITTSSLGMPIASLLLPFVRVLSAPRSLAPRLGSCAASEWSTS